MKNNPHRAGVPDFATVGHPDNTDNSFSRLIEKAENWFVYQEQRNINFHVYDEKKAIIVYGTAK